MKGRERQEARRRLDGPLLAFQVMWLAACVGSWARETRRASGVPVAEMARRMGTTERAIYRLERAEQAGRLDLKTLGRLAEALGCELRYAVVPLERTMEALAEDGTRLRRRLDFERAVRKWGRPGRMSGVERFRLAAWLVFRKMRIRV